MRIWKFKKLTIYQSFLVFFTAIVIAQDIPSEHHVLQPNYDVVRGVPNKPSFFTLLAIDSNSEKAYSHTGLNYAKNEIIVKFKSTIGDVVEERVLKSGYTHHPRLSDSLDRLNKKYKQRSSKPLFKNFRKNQQRVKALLKKDKAFLAKKEEHLLKRLNRAPKGAKVPDLSRIYKIQFELETGQSLQKVAAAYNNNPDVEYAELNYIVSVCAVPDDTYYPVQWSLDNTGQDYPISGGQYTSGTSGADINSPEAWDIHTGSSEVVVAVIDTGVDYTHRDLDDNMWVNEAEFNGIVGIDDDENGYIDDIYGYDFINNDSNPIDDHGHGTHCSGTIAAEGDNGVDITGVCWDAKIMALKFLGSGGGGYISDAVTAFYYAVENGADVVSNSWGGGGYMQSAQDAIDYAHSQGVVMVASAGNDDSNVPQYPASYDHVISVAATDCNDEKASFSNYGDWIDIAAPGVDILSLRASGTDMYLSKPGYVPGDKFVPYGDPDATLYIASGTSMACPHAAGACALLFSLYPEISTDGIEQYLLESASPISPGICASGRLNLNGAMSHIMSSQGRVLLDKKIYSCGDSAVIKLFDLDLRGNGIQQVSVSADGGDFETLQLAESTITLGLFTETISVDSADINIEDGVLQVSHGQVITVTYNDADDGTGEANVVESTAMADCQPPVIFNIQIDPIGPEPTVTFETDEPTTGRVMCSLSCGGPYTIEGNSRDLATTHTIKLTGVSTETDYFFVIEATDVAGNKNIDDNSGQCHAFTTNSPCDMFVPSEYPTIQYAIDHSWEGSCIWLADEVYTGEGNRDIDFKGKAITLRSENGPENCIIDCNGTEQDPHRGFYFHNNEDVNSVLDGLTITNGYAFGAVRGSYPAGGGICCLNASPTITNCTISNNWPEGLYNCNGPIISCTISSNEGPGLLECDGLIRNCTITGNQVAGLVYCDGTITKCTISANMPEGTGWGSNGGSALMICNGTISDCIIADNYSYDDGGGLYECTGVIKNCIISGNSASGDGGGIYGHRISDWTKQSRVSNCVISGNSAGHNGGGLFDYSGQIINCTIVGNSADNEGSAMKDCDGIIINSVIWNNIPGDSVLSKSSIPIYSCVQNSSEGIGGISANPCFVDSGYWDTNGTPEDANDDFWVDGDYHLRPESPCINAGSFAYCMTMPYTDGDGRTRLANSQVDIGCYETGSVPDIDGDWLGENDEQLYGTDPNLPDTDDDGLADGVEVLLGTNPLSADQLRTWQIPGDVATIQEALFFSRSGETIILEQGTYYETIYVGGRNIVLTSIDPNDHIIAATTVINGDIDANPETCNGSVIRYAGTEDVNSHIRGLTITGGKNENCGGGIYGAGADVSISNCTIVNNSAGSGGGLYDCDGIISDCSITGNSASDSGGGLYICYGSIVNCAIIGNFAGANGGGLCHAGTITNCVISDNFAGDSGAAIYNGYGNPITNSTISGNSALLGGGLFYKYALGICNTGASITNSIFANNENYAIYIGENIFFSEGACRMFPTGLPESMVTYCLFHNNPDGDWYDENTLLSSTGAAAINALSNANNNIDNAPLFVDQPQGDYHLLPDSPAIDAGDPNYEPEPNETDLDGRDRINDGKCNDKDIVDMGAYEFAWLYVGDFAGGCDVDFVDFCVFASTWLKEDGQVGYDPNCDISLPADSLIDEKDLKIFTDNWLTGVE